MTQRMALIAATLLAAAGVVAAVLAVNGLASSREPSQPREPVPGQGAASGLQDQSTRPEAPGGSLAQAGVGNGPLSRGEQAPLEQLPHAGTLTSRQLEVAESALDQEHLNTPGGFRRFDQRLPRDAIQPIYEPRFVGGSPNSLHPGELVLGIELNGESKAYPVAPLNFREMINDVVGGVPVLVTF